MSLNFLKSPRTLVAETQRRTQQAYTCTNFTSSNTPRNLIKFYDPFSLSY